ncbi:MAG TPA: hypothetical protein VMU17_07380, partial [Elusimicrobiota bacterium]|nr:hypothetical protein [Elusimicrobiota bacterium]
WSSQFAGTNATVFSKFLKADLLYRTSDYATAAQVYGDLAQTAQPDDLRPLALSAQSSAEEMAGHLDQALKLNQAFTDHYPDHFLAASAYLAQARIDELTGNAAAASAIYDRFAILYPKSPWADLANARLHALSGTPAAAPSAIPPRVVAP